MDSLYDMLKGRAYASATIASGRLNVDSQVSGYRDVYDLIMSDSEHPRQAMFLMLLTQEMPEGHRKVLLDGMAREYAALDGWLPYVEREAG